MIDELDPKHHVTLTKGDHKKITDLQVAAVDGGVHIEEMGDHEYWLRIGQQAYYIRSAAYHGPPIELVTAENHRRYPPATRRAGA